MSLRVQSGSTIWASLYPGMGATGAAIKAATATGEFGAGPLYNDGLLDAAEYRWSIASGPDAGVLVLREIGDVDWTGLSDGVHSFTYNLWEDEVLQPGPTTATITVGAGPGLTLTAANCSQVNAASTGAVSFAGASLALTAANCSQVNSASTGVVTLANPITLTAANCSQVNSATDGAVTYLPPFLLGAEDCSQVNECAGGQVGLQYLVTLPDTASVARSFSISAKTGAPSLYGVLRPQPYVWLHDPQAILDYWIDWGPWLQDCDDRMIGASVSAPDEVVVVVYGIRGASRVGVMIQPLVGGDSYPITISIITAAGRRDDRTFLLEVHNL